MADLIRAGEIMTEHLGQSLAAHADGQNLSAEQIAVKQQAILHYHMVIADVRRQLSQPRG